MSTRKLETRRGIPFAVREAGGGPPLVFLHGLAGLQGSEPLLDRLAQHFRVLAPVWPGFGEDPGEEQLEDMLDFALHGQDVLDALDLERPHLVGHSFGGMLAAEMACLHDGALGRLALIAPYGLWLDEHPIADVFATTPFDLPGMLFANAEQGQKLLTAGFDFSHDGALTDFMIANSRRMGSAGKVLFPVPNRRLSKRLYRIRTETLIVWGARDGLIPPVYAGSWVSLVEKAQSVVIEDAGHMLTCEQPAEVAEALVKFLR